ncbi:hypothetical protein WJX72_010874 [[Myrmecia] bisecta]|uniref:Topoisomerase 6 subunit A/Spo11 TOPRIM domain-containing protein n=1 Tax=[Myrmecia] bisecta TaxID=41462 RepID=A0AAW1RA37_9CHLO
MRVTPEAQWLDCHSYQQTIIGNINQIEHFLFRSSTASYILVLEKDTVLSALFDADFHVRTGCILITAKGMPDLATRAFLHRLHRSLPTLPVLGLVDWNPDGVGIVSVYKHGSAALESRRFVMPGLQWLGMRYDQLAGVDASRLQGLSRRDQTKIQTLTEGVLRDELTWAAELAKMEEFQQKAVIEAVFSVQGADFVDQVENMLTNFHAG